jgi:hypothetical protein
MAPSGEMAGGAGHPEAASKAANDGDRPGREEPCRRVDAAQAATPAPHDTAGLTGRFSNRQSPRAAASAADLGSVDPNAYRSPSPNPGLASLPQR